MSHRLSALDASLLYLEDATTPMHIGGVAIFRRPRTGFDYERLLALIEQRLAPFAPRPHWGKVFTASADDLASSYDRLPDFLDLTRHYDPAGKFRNAYTARYLGR